MTYIPRAAEGQMEAFQEAVAAKIESLPIFASNGAVITKRNGNLHMQATAAVQKKNLVAVVYPPEADISQVNIPGGYMGQVDVQIQIAELPSRNDGLAALAYAEKILNGLHHWKPVEDDPDLSWIQTVYARQGSQFVDESDEKYNVVSVYVRTEFGIKTIT